MSLSTTALQEIGLTEAPGLNDYARRYLQGWPLAEPAARRIFEQPTRLTEGSAWSDGPLAEELEDRHRRLGASEHSLRSLAELRGGAACVITGQQPVVLGGALYCAYKLAATVALARRLRATEGRPVVPVYWCGADDSDFDEARGTWLWSSTGQPIRAELPARAATDGSWVGDIAGEDLVRLESGLAQTLGVGPGGSYLSEVLGSLDPDWDLGDRTSAMFLRLFASDGLVVVDARSPRLRRLGRPLFERYAGVADEFASALATTAAELAAAGLQPPLREAAIRSGLFEVRDRRRTKLAPDALGEAWERDADLAPSVILRPLWQDYLFSPVSAVLGPSELFYHAQLAPAYELLGVHAAAPAPRPHLTLLPPNIELPSKASLRAELLGGGDAARAALGQMALPEKWAEAGLRLGRETDAALRAFTYVLGAHAKDKAVGRGADRVRSEAAKLASALQSPALEAKIKEDAAWGWAPAWLGPRSIPQERAYGWVTGWWWYGEGFGAVLTELGDRAVAALAEGTVPAFVGSLPAEAAT